MVCPNCKNEIKEGSKFCPRCGTLIPKQRRCSKCETPLDPSARFCPGCGAPNLYYDSTLDKTAAATSRVAEHEPVVAPPQPTPVAPPVAQPIMPPMQPPYPPQKNGSLKIWVWVSVIVAVITVGLVIYTLVIDSPGRDSKLRRPTGEVEASESVSGNNDNDYSYSSNMEVSSSSSGQDNERRARPHTPEPPRKVSVPDASYVSSEEAYSVYPGYMTDYSIGEDWRNADIVRRVISNGGDYYLMSASGYMDDTPVSFEAVVAPDNRVYGRYHNSNGTKLDLNGVVDSSGNLIIKLAHGHYTSYWVLHPDGSPHGSGTGTYYYTGPWGHQGKYTNMDINYYK